MQNQTLILTTEFLDGNVSPRSSPKGVDLGHPCVIWEGQLEVGIAFNRITKTEREYKTESTIRG